MTGGEDRQIPRQRLPGRRRGRRLRGGLESLLRQRLPELAVVLPQAGGWLEPVTLFAQRPDRLWVEIGFGAGEHLAWQADANPTTGLIGAEIFINGIAALIRALEQDGLRNLRIFQGDGRDLVDALPDSSVDRLFVLFPDPWRKSRHHKRRLIRAQMLDRFARILVDRAELRIATDHEGYLCWILEQLDRHPDFEWLARRPDDWRSRPADWPRTRYESKALAAGRRPCFLRFIRRPRSTRDAGADAGRDP